MKDVFIAFICSVFFLVACSTREQQFTREMKVMQSKVIRLPSQGLIIRQGEELQKVNMDGKGLKLVVYADSVECTACAIRHMDSWEHFIDYAEQFDNQLKFYFN